MFALRQLNQFEACSNAGFSKKCTKLPGEGSPAPAQDRSRPGAGVCEARAARRGRCARTAPASVAGRRAAGSRSIAARWHGHGHVARSVHARAAETRCRVSEVLWSGHRPPLPPAPPRAALLPRAFGQYLRPASVLSATSPAGLSHHLREEL